MTLLKLFNLYEDVLDEDEKDILVTQSEASEMGGGNLMDELG